MTSYVYENGRRYHSYSEGKYVSPNDETEQDRLDMVHHLQKMIHGGELCTAPLQDPRHVLDCGTGTGIWALEFGDQYPKSQVIRIYCYAIGCLPSRNVLMLAFVGYRCRS